MENRCNFWIDKSIYCSGECENLFENYNETSKILTKYLKPERNKFGFHDEIKLKCGLPCIGKYQVCEIHKCKVDNCYKKRSIDLDGKLKNYCDEHLCNKNGCNNIRINNSEFCMKHKCLICSNKVIDNSEYCKEHTTKFLCKKCQKEIIQDNGEQIKYYCEEHICQKCYLNSKENNMEYCKRCICSCKDCYEVIDDNKYHKRLCPKHRKTICCEINCYKEKMLNFDFCEDHKCSFIDCPCRQYENEYEDFEYCLLHNLLNNIATKFDFEINDEDFLNLVMKYKNKDEIIVNTEKEKVMLELCSKVVEVCNK
jgi:hypothetical protein